MEWIRNWIMSIAGSIVFGVICEMILPDGSIKKYVRVVLGIFLVIAAARPLAALRGTEPPDLRLPAGQEQAYARHREMDDLQRQQVLRIYTARLEEKLRASAAALCGEGAEVTGLEVRVAEDGEHFGEIQSVSASVSAPEGEEKGLEEELTKLFAQEYQVPRRGIRVKITAEKGEGKREMEGF